MKFFTGVIIVSISLFVSSVKSQYGPGNYRDRSRQNYGSRDHPYLVNNDRYAPWNSDRSNMNFINTGMNSRYSDSRCRRTFKDQHMEEYLGSVTVETRVGNIEGTYLYLCDGPGIPEHYRPKKDNINRQKIYRNLTMFLGIPYAKPPTRENGLRFKVRLFLGLI